ncbi:MAG TPA: hypothetical protein VFV50_16210 [Bdellovibrionales bacterium]|nr:hypothetical protein [Bdellovibrionales bacterium]
MNETSIRYLMSISEKHCAQGTLPPPGTPDNDLYLSILKDWDARKSAQILETNEAHPLLRVRAFLAAGRFQDANSVLRDLLTKTQADHELAEVYLEGARLAALEGQWRSALDLAHHALGLGPNSLSTLTLRNVCAIANFELGQLSRALEDLEKADALCKLFPYSTSRTYSDLLRIRILARDSGTRSARLRLDQQWSQLTESGRMTRDTLLSLIRTEIDLARIGQKEHSTWAAAAYILADAMGDELYAALGLFDLLHALPHGSAPWLEPLVAHAQRFNRVRLLNREVSVESPAGTSTGLPLSQTAVAMKLFAERAAPAATPAFTSLPRAKLLVIPQHRLALKVEPFTSKFLRNHKQLFDITKLLSEGPLPKNEFFTRIWEAAEYQAPVHDILIRRALYRLRRDMGADITSERQLIRLHDTLVLQPV